MELFVSNARDSLDWSEGVCPFHSGHVFAGLNNLAPRIVDLGCWEAIDTPEEDRPSGVFGAGNCPRVPGGMAFSDAMIAAVRPASSDVASGVLHALRTVEITSDDDRNELVKAVDLYFREVGRIRSGLRGPDGRPRVLRGDL